MNTPNDIKFSELSILEQREQIQEANPDMLAGVFSITGESSFGLEISCIENLLACYPNQLEDGQIKFEDDFSNSSMVIVNMGALRKGELQIIAGNKDNIPSNIKTPVLLSPGVIEYWEGEKGKKYTQTVLRDGGQMNSSTGITSLADANERTTTAGRNFTGKLRHDLEMENAEESPFLMQDKDGNFVLVTHNIEYKDYLVHSIKNFLENKYLKEPKKIKEPFKQNYHNEKFYRLKKEEYRTYPERLSHFKNVKNAFESKFKGIKYEDLGTILRSIIENDRFESYSWEEGEIEELDSTQLQLGKESGDFYVYKDEANNTIEYRAIRRITGFPKGLKPVGRIPLRLFLESQNQDPQFRNIKNVGAGGIKLVPTIQDVSDKVRETL